MRRHLVDVALQILDLRRLVEQRERELEAGQDGAQIVADAVQHRRALLDGALDAPLHLDEGVAGLAHLAGAARPELDLAALAEALGRLGEAQDRADLVAQEQDRDAEQHERGAAHPQQEDVRVRGVGLAAPGEHPHHGVVELDPDLDEVRAPDRVDPERPRDLARHLARTAPGRGSRRTASAPAAAASASGRISTSRSSRSLAMRASVSPFLSCGIGLVDVDQRRDVGGDGRGQAARHELPVPLHEDIGDDRLQQDHRRDDDDQRARVEPLRHRTEPSQRAKRP